MFNAEKKTSRLPIPPPLILTLLILSFPHCHFSLLESLPPLPLLPIPTSRQLSWQLTEFAFFFHFGPNTFTNTEWGDGRTDPSIFFPSKFDPKQWISVAKSVGASRVILTAKHHDGFCLWPSNYTDYSVKSSKWRGGNGDVVGELAVAAKEGGVQLGVYLSPWDRHERSFGKTFDYNQYYLGQMNELLTRYGEIREVFLDGAKGDGEKDMEYYFDMWFNVIHQLQPGAVIFSDAGPDIRWVGDELGIGGSTCWSSYNRSDAKIGDTDPLYLQGGDLKGRDWVPAECDVSIRTGWFWHKTESPKSALTLLDIYYKSVGRNCLLLLNVPPNSSGLISDEDIQVLQEFSELRDSIFANNLAKNATLTASSTRGSIGRNSPFDAYNVIEESIYTYWAPAEEQTDWVLYIDLGKTTPFNVLQVREPIQMGQRIISFHLDILNENFEWQKAVSGTTIGYKRLLLFPQVESQYLRLVIEEVRADPLISFVGVHFDPYSTLTSLTDRSEKFASNGVNLFSKLKDVILSSIESTKASLLYQI